VGHYGGWWQLHYSGRGFFRGLKGEGVMKPKTAFVKKLLKLRKKAIRKGMKLLTAKEIERSK